MKTTINYNNYNKLKPVYVICFLDAKFPHKENKLSYSYAMREETSHELYNSLLNVIFFELPRLRKESMKGLSPVEGWLYLLRNLHNFADTPEGMDGRFDRVLDAARMHSLPGKEKLQYFRAMINLTTQQDFYNGGYEDGVADGIQQGMEQERKANAQALLAAGVPAETIVKALGMTIEEVQGLA